MCMGVRKRYGETKASTMKAITKHPHEAFP
jgi:hypothetical protein